MYHKLYLIFCILSEYDKPESIIPLYSVMSLRLHSATLIKSMCCLLPN